MLSVLTVNQGAAARPRAELLLDWLVQRPEQVHALTETSAGPGTAFLLDQFRRTGHAVVKHTDDGDRGAALVSKVPILEQPGVFSKVTIPGRVAAAVLDTQPRMCVVSVYVPNRDRTVEKTERKEQFIQSLLDAISTLPAELRARTILCGDYNVISRTHQPAYPGFLPFEYRLLEALETAGFTDAHTCVSPGVQAHSWVGRTGDGYCYDYMHTGAELTPLVRTCEYLHETRASKLTDHAAVTLTLDVRARLLDITDPTGDDDATLF